MSQTCTYLRTWQHQMTTIMQPFQCDLQPQIQDMHRIETLEVAAAREPYVENNFLSRFFLRFEYEEFYDWCFNRFSFLICL